jgi:hypothetical protein
VEERSGEERENSSSVERRVDSLATLSLQQPAEASSYCGLPSTIRSLKFNA